MSTIFSVIKKSFTILQNVNPVIPGIFPVNFGFFTIDNKGLKNIQVKHLGQGYFIELGIVGHEIALLADLGQRLVDLNLLQRAVSHALGNGNSQNPHKGLVNVKLSEEIVCVLSVKSAGNAAQPPAGHKNIHTLYGRCLEGHIQ